MSYTLPQLQRRGEILRRMKELHTAANDREFTADESREWDSLDTEMTSLGIEVNADRRGEQLEQLEQRMSETHSGYTPLQLANGNGTLPGEGRTIRDVQGRELPLLSREDRLSDHLPRDRSQPRDLDRDKCWRGLLLGDWDGAGAEQRVMSGLTGGDGGWSLPTEMYGGILDYARNRSRCIEAGAQVIPMNARSLTVPTLESDPVSYPKVEGEEVSESTASIGAYNFECNTTMCLVPITLELAEDSSNLADTIERAMAASLALELDRQALYGTTPNQGHGLRYDDRVNSSVPGGGTGTLAMDDFLTAARVIRDANGEPSGAISSPRVWQTVEAMKDGEGNYLIKNAPPSFEQLQRFSTNQVTDTSGDADLFIGDWSQLWIALRTAARIEIFKSGYGPDSGSAMSRGLIFVRAYTRHDSCAIRPSWFYNLTGITY